MISRRNLLGAGAGITALAAPAVQAQTAIRWRMATSWPKNLVGPADSARRLAKRIEALSGGRIKIDVFAAGEIVPAFSVFDAVANGTVDMGHTASFFVSGKIPASVFFTTVPFGMGPTASQAWLDAGGGAALWDQLYNEHGVKPFLGGNTGPSLGGWFRKPLQRLEDVKGLRLRVTGLGGEVYRRLGAAPQAIPPGDVYPALERGTIDAVELLGPMNDADLGLARIAPHVLMPGFNKPNGASEALLSLKTWSALPPDLQLVVQEATAAEHGAAVAEAQMLQAKALAGIARNGALFMPVPQDLLEKAKLVAQEVLEETAAKSTLSRSIYESYTSAQSQIQVWERLTYLPS
jgi:TRAP-type mannitol/chloroaromatic compound transport system substrate-binding protein